MTCPTCGAGVEPEARFCWNCGTELAPRADERRVVTVVFGDIVGFTTLSETLDPERVKNLVDGCFRRLADDIAAFGGRVDNIVGDAIVALFGAPVAHEDDAERAVRAALRMQVTVASYAEEVGLDLRMRIGVNTGEVLVGTIGADRDYTAMGDVVNTASRLQDEAGAGAVVVGDATHDATIGVIRYEPVGEVRIRGRDGVVNAWRALRPVGLPGQRTSRPVTRLIGRDAEFRLLTTAVDHALRRRRAQLLLLLGDAGVGKARLAREVVRYVATSHQGLVLSGRCVPYGEADVWFPIADAVRSVLHLGPDAPEAVARQVVGEAVSLSFSVDDDHPSARRVVNGLLHLLGYQTPLHQLDPQRATVESHRALRTALAVEADRRPLVLFLVDLHWADTAVLELLEGLLVHLSRRPVVVVATARHALLDRWTARAGRSNVLAISLDPLDAAASATLLRELVGHDLPPELADELIARSGGNPLFVEELAQLARRGDAADLVRAPGNLRALVAARLDSLSDEERRVIEDAAVLGRRGPTVALEEMGRASRGALDVADVVQSLADQDLLVSDDVSWEFRSNLVREVAYERLTKAERARRHAGVAGYLEHRSDRAPQVGPVIAHHYRRAAQLVADIGAVAEVPDDVIDRAVRWTMEAGLLAEGGESAALAARQYGETMDLLGPGDDRWVDLALARARALVAGHQVAAGRQLVADLAGQPLDDARRARLEVLQGELEQRAANYESADRFFLAAVDRFRSMGDLAGVGDALRHIGMDELFSGDLRAAERTLAAAVESLAAAHDRPGEAWARQNLAWIAFAAGDIDEAERRIDDSVRLFTELDDQWGISFARGLLGYIRLYQGRLAEAQEFADASLRDARERSDLWGEGMMLVLIGSVALWSGDVGRAVELAESALGKFEVLDDLIGGYQARALLGRALVRAGRVTEGFDVFRAAGPAGAVVASEGIGSILITAAALASLGIGDAHEAERWLGDEPADSLDPGLMVQGERLLAHGLLALQQGRVEQGRQVLERAAPPVDRSAFAAAMAALARVATGDLDGARELVGEIERSELATYIDRTYAHVVAAFVACRRGDERAARAALEQAEAHAAVAPGDRLVGLLAAIAAAEAARVGDWPDRAELEHARDRRLSGMGVTAVGWRSFVERVLSVPEALTADAPGATG